MENENTETNGGQGGQGGQGGHGNAELLVFDTAAPKKCKPKTKPLTSEDMKKAWSKVEAKLPPAEPFLVHRDNKDEPSELRDVAVCVRVRPLVGPELESEERYAAVTASNPCVHLQEVRQGVRGLRAEKHSFGVDFTFGPQHSNQDVYGCTVKPVVELVFEGGVATVFAFGQTGSGKTFTISGLQCQLATDVFLRLAPAPAGTGGEEADQCSPPPTAEAKFRVFVSCFELFGDNICDLLNDKQAVEMMEDGFGDVQLKGLREFEPASREELLELIERAAQFRRTAATFKNETSSRSHAVLQLRVSNLSLPEVEDGRLFMVDLAGSEGKADSKFHNKQQQQETKAINLSLLTLKECIRSRTLASMNLDSHFHVPYRTSKLTMLLKPAFELESAVQCRTVVIAAVSPTDMDIAHTLNTLRYAAPLKVAIKSGKAVKPDPRNPGTWSNATLKEWTTKTSKGQIDPEVLCPIESGLQLCRVPEAEFLRRVLAGSTWGPKRAKEFYVKLWSLVVDARVRARKAKLKKKSNDVNYECKEDQEAKQLALLEERVAGGEVMSPSEGEQLRRLRELAAASTSYFAAKQAAKMKDTVVIGDLQVEQSALTKLDSLTAEAEDGILTLSDAVAFCEWAVTNRTQYSTLKHVLEAYKFDTKARQRVFEHMQLVDHSH